MTIDVPANEPACRHLQRLYEISKRLLCFDGVDETVVAVVATIAETLALRSTIFILETAGDPLVVAWQRPGSKEAQLVGAMARARALYAYLVRAPGALPADARRADAGKSLLLPMVVRRRPVFGALQLEADDPLDERELGFANAAVNQLAIALDRHAAALSREVGLRGKFEFARNIAESVGEGLLAVDLRGQITHCNAAAETLLGVVSADVVGRPLAEVLTVQRLDGAVIEAVDSPFDAAIRGHVVTCDEQRFMTATRAPFPVSYTAAPFHQSGHVHGAVLVFRDILDIKRAELGQRFLASVSLAAAESLAPSAALTAIMQAVVPGFADVSFADLVRDGAPVERVGIVFADADKQRRLAAHVASYGPPTDSYTPQRHVLEDRVSLLIDDVQATPGIARDPGHAELLRAIDVRSMIVVPVFTRDTTLGVLTFATAESNRRYTTADVMLAEDVAHRTALAIDNARLYEAASRAINARQNVLLTVAHDLKNPLNVILMAIDLLEPDRVLPAGRPQLAMVRRAALRMNRLTRDLLDTASIESGHLACDLQPLALATVVLDALDALAPRTRQSGVTFACELPDALPAVLGDADRIHQVITNLVDNALKFTPRGGVIRVAAQASSGSIELSITDPGPGIPEADLPHLFDRFWQASRTARLGSGLGLYIVKGIVDAHHGRVTVESVVGAGTTFFVSLPLAPIARA